MLKLKSLSRTVLYTFSLVMLSFFFVACDEDDDDEKTNNGVVFLFIDENSIDNGNEPNNFSEQDVNDQLATLGLRTPLKYFQDNPGKEITLYTGEVGDEGWFAPTAIPPTWKSAGPESNGLANYLVPGPGLGAAFPDDDREVLLDEIPDVLPLRATGLKMLEGKTVYAVVYDSDISINYSPIKANLMGANLGRVSFDVLEVKERTDGSDSSLPLVTIRIREVEDFSDQVFGLFSNAPVPSSSSEPFDVTPPANTTNAIIKSAE